MRTTDGDKVFAIIRAHIGAEDAITAPEIARELRWKASDERKVRRIISDEGYLWPDILVCSIPGKGYFCATSYEEAESYDSWIAGLLDSAREKQTAFRAQCRKMGFRFAQTNRHAGASAKAEMSAS
jgi:hypothetical protein